MPYKLLFLLKNCKLKLTKKLKKGLKIKTSKKNSIEVPNTLLSIETDKITFKPMTLEELAISFERMQRFNSPFKKYERVYREILIKHLLTPKISLKNYYSFTPIQLQYLAQTVWNSSLKELSPEVEENYSINPYIFYEESRVFFAEEIIKKLLFSQNFEGFSFSEDIFEKKNKNSEKMLRTIFEQNGFCLSEKKLSFLNNYKDIEELDFYSKLYICLNMNFPLNINGFLRLAEEKTLYAERLFEISEYIQSQKNLSFKKLFNFAEKLRTKKSYKRPVRLVVLVEGITEEILLPLFSKACGHAFEKSGVELIASGGKNQVGKLYRKLSEQSQIPIFVLLDSDAESVGQEIKRYLRSMDSLYIISCGEFEDILSDELICKSVNSYYKLTGGILKSEIVSATRKTQNLFDLWKQKGFGEFKKAEFASIISKNISSKADLTTEMEHIVSLISQTLFGTNV